MIVTAAGILYVRGQFKYKPDFFVHVPVFLHILPSPLYTADIAPATSLCPLQKKFVVACPSIVAQKVSLHRRLYPQAKSPPVPVG